MLEPRIQLPRQEIEEFCRKWHVQEFSLFGSVLREDFHEGSDVDVMVTFDPSAVIDLWDMGNMYVELERMFGRRVDLVEKKALQNPFRRASILRESKVVYAA